MEKKTCEWCEGVFQPTHYNRANRFCSQDCYFKWRRNAADLGLLKELSKKTCENCGEKFFPRSCKPNRFCSTECHNKWRRRNLKPIPLQRRDAYLKNRKKYLQKYKRKYQEKRQLILEKLGNKCVNCGFNDYRALQIDHIHGNGSKETRKIGTSGLYRKILSMNITDIKKEYQLLCANCNWIKRHEKKEERRYSIGEKKRD